MHRAVRPCPFFALTVVVVGETISGHQGKCTPSEIGSPAPIATGVLRIPSGRRDFPGRDPRQVVSPDHTSRIRGLRGGFTMRAQMNGRQVDVSARTCAGAGLQDCAAYRWEWRTGHYEYVSPVIGQITGSSAEEIYAMSRMEWLGRISPEDCGRLLRQTRTNGGSGQIVAYRFRHKDGQYRWVADRSDLVPGPDGRPHHEVGVLRRLASEASRTPCSHRPP
jgi:PAS domain-containing protein